MREAKSIIDRSNKLGNCSATVASDITKNDLLGASLNREITADKEKVAPLSYWMSKPDVVVNLIVMIFIWLFTVFDFYLINFLMNTFE